MHPPVYLAFGYDEHNKKQLAQLRFGQAAKFVVCFKTSCPRQKVKTTYVIHIFSSKVFGHNVIADN